MNYVFVYFLPGSAGNFFSRCLNLLSSACCFVNRIQPQLPKTLEEKIDLLSYNSVHGKKFNERIWTQFEVQLAHYSGHQPHWELPADAYSIWFSHPDPNQHASLAGADDRVYKFYIDSSDCFEWGIMNALHKNSYLDVKWFVNAVELKTDPSIHNISLKNIIQGPEEFLAEFVRVCEIIQHVPTNQELSAVEDLYHQWLSTTLTQDQIPRFKRDIGFFM